MKSLKNKVSLLFVLTSLASCNYQNAQNKLEWVPSETIEVTASEQNSYAYIKQNIFSPHCIKCHGADKAEAGIRLDTYGNLLNSNKNGSKAITVGNHKRSSVFNSINENAMPKNATPLSDKLKATLKKWIDSGAPYFADQIKPAIPTEPAPTKIKKIYVSYQIIKDTILEPHNCLGCHDGDSTRTKLDLTSYEKLLEKQPFNIPAVTPNDIYASNIYLKTRNGYMPKKRARLSAEKVQLLKDWILLGAPLEKTEVVKPVLKEEYIKVPVYADIKKRIITPYCLKCHNPQKLKGGIDASSYEALLSDNGETEYPLVTPDNLDESPMFLYTMSGYMPYRQKDLSPEEVLLIGRWIKNGAKEK